MKNNLFVVVVLLVLVGAGAFYGGMQYQKSKLGTGSSTAGSQDAAGQRGRFQGRAGQSGGRVIGQVVNLDNNSLTVKLQDGSTKIVILSGKTTYSKSTEGAITDIKVGGEIAVFGSTNSDGSVTAQNVQLNPQIGMRNRPTPGK